MKKVRRNQVVYKFDPANQTAISVRVGELFAVEMEDSQNGRVTSEQQLLTEATNLEHVNPCTGPVYVEDAMPGDVVVVEILKLKALSPGFSCVLPGDGILRDRTQAKTRLWHIKEGVALMQSVPQLCYPVSPMIGTLGTTPAKPIATGYAGQHGGNLDNPLLGEGAKLYLPVFVPGALLLFGDCHASQADGEVMMPIEVKGDALVRVSQLIKETSLPCPIVETIDRWATNGVGKSVEEAIHKAVSALAELLMYRLEIDIEDAELLIAAWGQVRLNQVAGMGIYDAVARAEIPKGIDKSGRLEVLF